MANVNAQRAAATAVDKANRAKGMLLTSDGAVKRATGEGGFGLIFLAEAVGALAEAVRQMAGDV